MKTLALIGCGWLGRPLARQFQRQKYSLVVTTRSKSNLDSLRQEGASAMRFNLGELLPESIRSADTVIINLPSKDVEGFQRLAKDLERSDVRHILFVSSTSVYPDIRRVMREDAAMEVWNHPLVRIENLFRSLQNKDITVLRLAGLVGPGRHPGRFFRRAGVLPAPSSPVNLIHLDDAVSIIIRIVKMRAWGQTYNACADTHPKKGVFYSHACKSLGASMPELGRDYPGRGKRISNAKLKRQLSLSFKYPDCMEMLEVMKREN